MHSWWKSWGVMWLVILVLAAPWVQAQTPVELQLQKGATTGAGAPLSILGYSLVTAQITGAGSSDRVVNWESSETGDRFDPVTCKNLATLTQATTASADGTYQCPIAGNLLFRARVSGGTTGTVSVFARALANVSGGGGGCIVISDIDGSPTLSCPTALKFSNGAVTDNGDGTATVITGAGGGGDASTNTATSVDNEVALFSGTGGKTLKRATLTAPVAKSTAGVLGTATAGTDYVAPGGPLGTPSSGTLTNTTGLPLATGVTGLLPVANAGFGAAPGADDQVFVSSSTTAGAWKSLPSCDDTAGQHLNYTAATNTWGCGTSTSGGDAFTNTATAVDSEIALFSGTGGKILKRATGTGVAKLTAGVLGVATLGTEYGDASTNTATAVDSEIAVFSGTGGKILKRATGSGVAKITSGVLGTATAGTDYAGLASINTFAGRQDATGATSTAPVKVGTSLPGTCAVGDLFFKSDATAGQNLYECTAVNTWTQQLNTGNCSTITEIDGVPSVACPTAVKFSNGTVTNNGDGTVTVITGAGGGGDASTNTVTSVDSELAVFSGTGGKTFKRGTGTGVAKVTSGVLGIATAGTDYAGLLSANTFLGRQDASGAASTAPAKVGTSLPGVCVVGDLYFKSDATAGQNLYECTATNTWTQQLNTVGGDASTNTASSVDSELALFSGTGGKTFKRATGSGVAKMTAGVLSTATPGTDYAGLASANAFTGRQDASGAASTAPAKVGTSLPGTCVVGDLYFKSDATAGQNLYECAVTNTWTQQLNTGGGGAGTVTATAGALTNNAVVLGAGGVDTKALPSLGTASTVLHGNATGAPGYGAVALGTEVSGNLHVANLNSGTGASSATWWNGAEAWTTPTKTDVGLGNVDNKSETTLFSDTGILSNKQITPRTVPLTPAANVITPNADTTDIGYNYTLAADTLFAAPTATGSNPVDGQLLEVVLKTAAVRLLTWNAMYSTECGLPLPTGTTGDGATYNHFLFKYTANSAKWCLLSTTKSPPRRVTTLASGTTYTCPGDTSDLCEMAMTGAAGTLTMAAPTGAPNNGDRLTLLVKCTNLQTFVWNAIYLASPSQILPAVCPGVNIWNTIDLQYNSTQAKWLVMVGGDGWPTRLVCSGDGGSSNNAASGSGSDFNHTPTCTVPKDYFTNHRQLEVCALVKFTTTTPGTVPTLTYKLKYGSTVIFTHGTQAPTANRTNLTYAFCYWLVAESAPGGTANIVTAPISVPDAICCSDNINATAQPVAVATNTTQDITFTSLWGTAGSGNIITLEALRVRSDN